MGTLEFCLSLVIVAFSVQVQARNTQNTENLNCNSNDMRALQDFIAGLESALFDGRNWNTSTTTTATAPNNNSNNSDNNCCNWVGVTCKSFVSLGLHNGSSMESGRVINLDLGRKKLVGKLSDSLGLLDQLRTLNLSHNFLKGSLPVSLLHLPHLEVLDLSNNDFSGFIPTSINLPSIRVLNISNNLFEGQVPVGVCENSTQISHMVSALNFFAGHIPPGLGNCTSLVHLCLGTNSLYGGLPEDLFQLPKLALLGLQDNRFSGKLSSRIGNLSNLIHLDVSMNVFYGHIPDVFYNFTKLSYFSAQSNKFSGPVPPSLSNSRTVVSLSLRNNSLYGPIILNCSEMVSLVSLDMATNHFSGPIPDNLPSCPQLTTINLARNNFSGSIPESFRNLQSLSHLSLSNSSVYNLSSALEILQHCRNLTTLVLTLNFPKEELPSTPSLEFKSLKALIIANCRLTGAIPLWLSGCKKLQLLDLSWNRLRGTIPPWFGNFQSLFYLDLSNNSFTGEIPINLTQLPRLIFRNISLEEPSLDFPFFLKRNTSARGLQYNQLWSFPPTLELSNNFLTGPISPEFGNLKKVHTLDLKCNNLSGTIPSSLSQLTSVECLDLSHNELSGTIPPSLVHLNFLSMFSVAYNNLSGVIPTGGQFQTFPNSSFVGNPGLCGEHVSSPCQTSNQVPHKSLVNSKNKKGPIIGMAIGIGFGTVFLLALMLLIVLRASSRKVADLEKEADVSEKHVEPGSRLMVLFQTREYNNELSVDDLLRSMNNFDQANIIGCGGFGLVYKGILPDGRKVAIKRLSGQCGQIEREFQAEVESLSRARHPNLVHLQGYCLYKNDKLLIYSYMENDSLDYWLHEKVDGPSSLDWDTRLQIARGAARGLAYLHQSCEPRILHRDIKSSNILLDENFQAHLADFGLARLILPYDTHVTTDCVGTLGYIPPEYGQASFATYKGDVYSFGVVLLELLTGRRPMDMCKPKGSRDLISWVIQMKRDKRESEVFDPFIYSKEHAEELSWVLEIAGLCLSECPKIRPCTQQLVSWLDNII